jgi:hypothetical protein
MRRIIVPNFYKQLTPAIAFALLALLTDTASASTVVFEKVGLFKNKTFFTEELQLETAGKYQATVTDFEFPKPLKKMALNITTSKDTLGTIFGPGTLDFEADPGTYHVSFFALAGKGKNRNDNAEHRKNNNKHKRDKQKHKKNGRAGNNDHGKSAKQHVARTWQEKPDLPELAYDGDTINLGQYGIEIAHTDSTVVPIPAAVWLFLSGLLSVGAVGIRRHSRV